MDNSVNEINVTPLVDVLLVLLILLIITVPIMTHSVSLDLPHGQAFTSRHETIHVDIDFDGRVFWNGKPSPSDETLERWLRTTNGRAKAPYIRVYPDKRAP